jgi:acetyltransferase-like isoleucine patch superfamily enzyme
MSLEIIKQYPLRFSIDETAVLLGSTMFRFDIPRNEGTCVSIGPDSMINAHFIFESNQGRIDIGSRTFINGGTRLISRSKIEIGNDVTIAWGCTIYDHDSHSLHWEDRADDLKQQLQNYRAGENMATEKNWSTVKSKPIIIKDKVWIGFDCVILKGVTIGEGAVIGAKSVVTKDVAPWTVVAGNPAKFIKHLEQTKV